MRVTDLEAGLKQEQQRATQLANDRDRLRVENTNLRSNRQDLLDLAVVQATRPLYTEIEKLQKERERRLSMTLWLLIPAVIFGLVVGLLLTATPASAFEITLHDDCVASTPGAEIFTFADTAWDQYSQPDAPMQYSSVLVEYGAVNLTAYTVTRDGFGLVANSWMADGEVIRSILRVCFSFDEDVSYTASGSFDVVARLTGRAVLHGALYGPWLALYDNYQETVEPLPNKSFVMSGPLTGVLEAGLRYEYLAKIVTGVHEEGTASGVVNIQFTPILAPGAVPEPGAGVALLAGAALLAWLHRRVS
jgi:hypothetical protein